MGIAPTPFLNIPSEIVIDGKIVYKNLKELGRDEGWLLKELKRQVIAHVKDAFYAELQSDGSSYVQKKD